MDQPTSPVTKKMRDDWDERARENAEYYVASSTREWDRREFFRSGEINVANEIMPDMRRICGGERSPFELKVLEIGCGVGRMTRTLARVFRHVTAVDISSEMIGRATANLSDLDNVTLILGDGASLSGVGDHTHDFAFSFIVFQHIPSREVIASYCREVHRVLKPGSLFKFQVQGAVWDRGEPPDTWNGVSITADDARQLAAETGFSLEQSLGDGTQYYWLWFRKP